MTGLMVSVVVPTCRRPQRLEQCLQALTAQTFPTQGFEVMIVDDGPDDPRTREVVAEWQARLNDSALYISLPVEDPIPVTGLAASTPEVALRYAVSNPPDQWLRLTYLPTARNGGPAAARNLGWRVARGEIIAFTDDDCLPEPDWLANGVAAFGADVAGVSGRVIVPLGPQPTDYELNYTHLSHADFVTANCFYRRSALEAVGGFDEGFRMAWREDSDLCLTLQEHGYRLVTAPSAVVIHPVHPAPWGSSLRQQKKSFYNALLYKKHPDQYWGNIQSSPPWPYYATLGALAVTLAGLISHTTRLAALGFAAWLSLDAAFTLRRLKHTSHAPRHVTEMVVTSMVIPILSVYWRLRGALHWKVWFL